MTDVIVQRRIDGWCITVAVDPFQPEGVDPLRVTIHDPAGAVYGWWKGHQPVTLLDEATHVLLERLGPAAPGDPAGLLVDHAAAH